jgi:hypothetical protein
MDRASQPYLSVIYSPSPVHKVTRIYKYIVISSVVETTWTTPSAVEVKGTTSSVVETKGTTSVVERKGLLLQSLKEKGYFFSC